MGFVVREVRWLSVCLSVLRVCVYAMGRGCVCHAVPSVGVCVCGHEEQTEGKQLHRQEGMDTSEHCMHVCLSVCLSVCCKTAWILSAPCHMRQLSWLCALHTLRHGLLSILHPSIHHPPVSANGSVPWHLAVLDPPSLGLPLPTLT